jgi:hypothetical protein
MRATYRDAADGLLNAVCSDMCRTVWEKAKAAVSDMMSTSRVSLITLFRLWGDLGSEVVTLISRQAS